MTVRHEADELLVSTGVITAAIPRCGKHIFRSLQVEGRVVATGARLLESRQGSQEPDSASRVHSTGRVEEVEVEQDGAVRAVVTLCGVYVDTEGRKWLPFTLRLVFMAGAEAFHAVHTFICDGDPETDFLASLGPSVEVPLAGEPHDRHVRFAGADGGVLREAVRAITGLRRDPGAAARKAQLDRAAAPPADPWEGDMASFAAVRPVLVRLQAPSALPRAFHIAKRTATDRPWIDVAHGTRAAGFATLSMPLGGVGVRDFWHSYPTGLDILHTTADTATVTAWMWTPDAPPMDLRCYHDGLGQASYHEQLRGLEVTQEDYKTGLSPRPSPRPAPRGSGRARAGPGHGPLGPPSAPPLAWTCRRRCRSRGSGRCPGSRPTCSGPSFFATCSSWRQRHHKHPKAHPATCGARPRSHAETIIFSQMRNSS